MAATMASSGWDEVRMPGPAGQEMIQAAYSFESVARIIHFDDASRLGPTQTPNVFVAGESQEMSKQLRVVLCALACAVTACAAPPPPGPATPIASVDSIAGKWQGTLMHNGSAYSTTAIIRPDGTWSGETAGFRSHGTYRLANGEARWHSLTTGANGTWILRKVDGKIELFLQGSNGVTAVDTRAN